MTSATIDTIWSPRDNPLAPLGVAACSAALSTEMIIKLLKKEDSELAKLQCVAGSGVIFILADENDLPWLDGVVYLGQERNSTIYIPTNLNVSVPLPLLERALLVANPNLLPPIAVLPSVARVLSLAKPFIPNREKLHSLLEKL